MNSPAVTRAIGPGPGAQLYSQQGAAQGPAFQVSLPLTVASAAPAQGVRQAVAGATYQNPVFHHDAPDISVIRDGARYVAFTTQTIYDGKLVHLPMLESPDLVNWKLTGNAMPTKPSWVRGDVWAPHIVKFGDQYNMYYAARERKSASMAIGVQTSKSLAGPWTDKGSPIVRRGFGEQMYSVLDPFAVETPDGERILYWGSGYTPLRAQKLSSDGLQVEGKPVNVMAPDRSGRDNNSYESMIEGPWVVKHADYYYLMYSGNETNASDPHYAVMVARSKSPYGPFEKDPNNPILERNEKFVGPGHNAMVQDDHGNDWMMYHALQAGNADKHGMTPRTPMLDRVTWNDGWPVVNDGKGPSSLPQPAPAEDVA